MAKRSFWQRTKFKTSKFLAGDLFYRLILELFIFQAGWIALSGLYPMAFDEETHLGIINYFRLHPNPFFAHQPASLNIYGAVVHDPSYLYRYLMAGPWWVIVHLTSNFMAQAIILRFINIALFTIGLVLFKKLLSKLTTSKLLVNLTLLLFVLTPITTQLAAQINYDNLLIPLMLVCILLTLKIVEKLKAGQIDIWNLGRLICLLLITGLVKYTFLTVMAPIVIYLLWQFIKIYKHKFSVMWRQIKSGLPKLGKFKLVFLAISLLLSFGLFFERYGLNTVRYHSPNPSCVKVLGTKACQSYSIYQRSLYYATNKPNIFTKNPALFTLKWLKHMLFNLMMAINGPASGYSVGQPLSSPYTAAIIFGSLGIILSVVFARRIFKTTALKLILLILVFYLLALWVTNYVEYFHTGRRVAIQGRYLVPFLPFIYLIFLLAFKQLLQNWPKLRASLATLLVAGFLAGGGLATFILHSDANWYWPNQTVIKVNQDARSGLRHVVPSWNLDYKPSWQSSFEF